MVENFQTLCNVHSIVHIILLPWRSFGNRHIYVICKIKSVYYFLSNSIAVCCFKHNCMLFDAMADGLFNSLILTYTNWPLKCKFFPIIYLFLFTLVFTSYSTSEINIAAVNLFMIPFYIYLITCQWLYDTMIKNTGSCETFKKPF